MILLLCAVLMLLVACRPKGILTSRKMRNILYELHRADAILQVAGYAYGHDEDVAKYYQEVLDKNGITKAQFDSSLVWYTDHPQIFNKIYPKVLARCEKEDAYWVEKEHAEQAAQEQPQRELKPLEELYFETSHGVKIDLLPPAPPDTAALLLPVTREHADSVKLSDVSDQLSDVSDQTSDVSRQLKTESKPDKSVKLTPDTTKKIKKGIYKSVVKPD